MSRLPLDMTKTGARRGERLYNSATSKSPLVRSAAKSHALPMGKKSKNLF